MLLTLTQELKTETKALHTKAESTNFIKRLLKGQLGQYEYINYLFQLKLVYSEIEKKMMLFSDSEVFEVFSKHGIFRAMLIEKDIAQCKPKDNQLLAATSKYLQCIKSINEASKMNLLGHAYVRYMGDLKGGQIIAGILKKKYGYCSSQLNFYDFTMLNMPCDELFLNIKKKLNNFPFTKKEKNMMIDAAIIAFQCNIALLEDLNNVSTLSC